MIHFYGIPNTVCRSVNGSTTMLWDWVTCPDCLAVKPDAITKALKVMVATPHIRKYLEDNDPKALQQAFAALGTCPECGQGPAGVPAYEHKSICRLWRDYADHFDGSEGQDRESYSDTQDRESYGDTEDD